MDILAVIRICLPVFALIAVGWSLRRSGFMGEQARVFLGKLVYWISLPIIVFLAVLRQDFGDLMNAAVIVASLAAILLSVLAFLPLWSWIRGRSLRWVLLVLPFWGNSAYLGLPLAERAYGDAGLSYAAITNAFAMPVFILLGSAFLVCGRAAEAPDHERRRRDLLAGFGNPIVLAAFAGIALAGLRSACGFDDWIADSPRVAALLDLTGALLAPWEAIGLPLALISVGGALDLGALRGDWRILLLGSLGKLALCPILCWGLLTLWPDADPVAITATTLVMAMPASVASFVIADRLAVHSRLIAAHLVLSTLLAALTIPLWLLLLTPAA